jgi:uncharacterized protein (DUF4415 family)
MSGSVWGVPSGCAKCYPKAKKGNQMIEETIKRKGRGPSKKPTLFNTSLRLSREVMDYFNTNHPYSKQAKIREILTEYVNSQQQGATNGNSK